MVLFISDNNQTSQWAVRVKLNFGLKHWEVDANQKHWGRIAASRQGPFEIKPGGIIWLMDRLTFTEKRNPVILWDAPSHSRDVVRTAGKGKLFDPVEAGLKDTTIRWAAEAPGAAGEEVRSDALELLAKHLPERGLQEPPNCVEGKARKADPVNADGNRATGCGGFVGWYFAELQKMGYPVPDDRVTLSFEWTPPGATKKVQATEVVYLTGPTFGHQQVVQAIEKGRPKPLFIYYDKKKPDVLPKPGDVYILYVASGLTRHEGVVVSADGEKWRTADGGGGVSGYAVGYTDRRFTKATSEVSGGKEVGYLRGWIDIAALLG